MSTGAGSGGSTIARILGRRAAIVLIAVFVPLILIGDAVHLIAHQWFVRLELGRLPSDPYGMKPADQRRLADAALDSIVPFGGGDGALTRARLANGNPAYDAKEHHHLRAVRAYMLGLYLINAIGLVALAVLLVIRRTRRLARDALVAGAWLTLGIAIFCGIYVAVAPVSFLGGFHRVFFRGSSWRFEDTETLRRLFPDAFWSFTAGVLGAVVALQAVAILVVARLRR